MSILTLLANHAIIVTHQIFMSGTLASEAILHGQQFLSHACNELLVLTQLMGNISFEEFNQKLQDVRVEDQLGWLTGAGKYFIGIFEKGGEIFVGFITGIIPTLIVLMTAFYALTEVIGEERMHGVARRAARFALTRYTVLPVLSVFFLTNPMACTFGAFLEEKHKPAFYDANISYVHPLLGLFPHTNPSEYFVWGGILVALLELEKKGVVPPDYHISMAICYALVGLLVILLKGMLTERITIIMARRQGVEL